MHSTRPARLDAFHNVILHKSHMTRDSKQLMTTEQVRIEDVAAVQPNVDAA